ncbi:MAG: FecR domain-containing protein [Bacteroidota bacterium]
MNLNEEEKELLEQWLNNQSFINWAKQSDAKDMESWELYFNQHPDHWELAKMGKVLVLGISFNKIPNDPNQANRVLSGVLDQLENKEGQEKRKTRAWIAPLQNTWKLAGAIALIGLLSWFSYVQFFHHGEVLLSTDYGEQKEHILSDGSKVILNANSRLSYNSQNPREVRLEGEAFFEVKKMPETNSQFQVLTQDLRVMVLGTSFNVNARNDQTKVFLEEGKVDLEVNDLKTGVIQMNPGDLITYSKKQKKLKENRNNASALENSSWKAGTLIFNNTPLQEALYEIEDIYGIQFVIQSEKVKEEVISGGVPIKDLGVSLQTLSEVYGIHIRSEGKRYFITGKHE